MAGKTMDNEERRKNILTILKDAKGSVTGTALAEKFGVSRQIIVGDISLLRAKGHPIISTPRGYNLQKKPASAGVKESFLCRHNEAMMGPELKAIVDNGGYVSNVIVMHDVYGYLEGELNIRSRRDVDLFLKQMEKRPSTPLSAITGGIHAHVVETRTQEEMDAIRDALENLGVLYHPEKEDRKSVV